MFCIFRTVTGILTVVTVRSLIYSSNSGEIEDPSSNFKIMPSLLSSISFLRLNPNNVVFSPQINVLPLYSATLGFHQSRCTQTYAATLGFHQSRCTQTYTATLGFHHSRCTQTYTATLGFRHSSCTQTYNATLGFRHSHCTQTYNVQLQTQ